MTTPFKIVKTAAMLKAAAGNYLDIHKPQPWVSNVKPTGPTKTPRQAISVPEQVAFARNIIKSRGPDAVYHGSDGRSERERHHPLINYPVRTPVSPLLTKGLNEHLSDRRQLDPATVKGRVDLGRFAADKLSAPLGIPANSAMNIFSKVLGDGEINQKNKHFRDAVTGSTPWSMFPDLGIHNVNGMRKKR